MKETVENNSVVRVHYTGTLEDGSIFDSSKDRKPLEFKVGAGNMILGFEKAVMGMVKGEKKTVTLPSKEAYGDIQTNLIQEISNSHLPDDLKPQVGMELISETTDGHRAIVKINEVRTDSIVIDANHPLAGKDLTFEIELIEIS